MLGQNLIKKIDEIDGNDAFCTCHCVGHMEHSKFIIYASISNTKRNGLYKYTITPSSISEKRIFPYAFLNYSCVPSTIAGVERYAFEFCNNRRKETLCYEANSIEELCEDLDVTAYYDDVVIALARFCNDVPVTEDVE